MFEVICDSLLNGPFKWIPLPFESSSKFWLLQQFGCSKQSRTQVMKAEGLPADLQTRRTELHTEKLLVENLGNALCSATATGGDGSFPSHPPALPLLRCPSLLAVLPPSHPTSLILYHTAQ